MGNETASATAFSFSNCKRIMLNLVGQLDG
jgi:hypothetical protein